MLQCVPPFLSQKIVEHLMKNYIKAFLATGIGMAMMKLVAENEKDKVGGIISCLVNEIIIKETNYSFIKIFSDFFLSNISLKSNIKL